MEVFNYIDRNKEKDKSGHVQTHQTELNHRNISYETSEIKNASHIVFYLCSDLNCLFNKKVL